MVAPSGALRLGVRARLTLGGRVVECAPQSFLCTRQWLPPRSPHCPRTAPRCPPSALAPPPWAIAARSSQARSGSAIATSTPLGNTEIGREAGRERVQLWVVGA